MASIKVLKDAVRSTIIYKPFFLRKQHLQEKEYLSIRDDAYRKTPDAFKAPGYESLSRRLLARTWNRHRPPLSNPKDVRIFVADCTNMPPWWLQGEVQRSFDAVVFSIVRHWRGFLEGRTDLVSFSHVTESAEMPFVNLQDAPEFGAWRTQLQEDLLEAVKLANNERPVDLVFLYGSATEFDPETLTRIRGLGVPVALWWLDELHSFNSHKKLKFPNGQVPLIGAYDVHLTNTFQALGWYLAQGTSSFYMPQAVDVQATERKAVAKDIPVSFVGAAYGYRLEFIRKLKRAGVDVACFGSGWNNGWAEDDVTVFSRSVINLGIGSTGYSSRMTCIKGRDFEVPGSGNFYMTTFSQELPKFFHIGKEIVCYQNELDCVELIRYFLNRPDEAERIGVAGRQRCITEHTWTRRIEGLLMWMGILL